MVLTLIFEGGGVEDYHYYTKFEENQVKEAIIPPSAAGAPIQFQHSEPADIIIFG